MFFACPRARAYGVRSEVGLYNLCQRGVSEVVQRNFRFIKLCKLLSSLIAKEIGAYSLFL